jgi:hypothetical protein
MIETTLIQYLNNSETLGVPVYAQRPENPPAKYVLIDKTGSSNRNRITTSTFAIQSYAERLLEAAELNETLKEVMEDFAAEDEIGRVNLVSDYNFTSTQAKQYRYQAVFAITHY